MVTFYQKAMQMEQEGQAFVVITMLATRGHAPQDPGAKAIVTSEGLCWGTVGGGKVEAKAIALALQMLKLEGTAVQRHVWNLQRDVGMSCGGEVEMLWESVGVDQWPIAIFGAGHVAQALVRQLLFLPCQITCFDTRKEWLERLPHAPNLRSCFTEDLAVSAAHVDIRSFCVVMTKGHATDLPVLESILKKFTPPYLGVIGSKVKARKIRWDLQSLGIEQERLERLRCPMGLDISNSNHPAEIAVSIAAELIEKRRRKP